MATRLVCKIPIGMAEALSEAGLSQKEILATARLPSRLLDIPGPHVSIPEYYALWQAIRTVSGDPNIGIRLARSVRPDLTEPYFLAVMSAVNVAGALEVVAAYKRILSPEEAEVHTDLAARRVVLTIMWPKAEVPYPQALADSALAFIVEMCRRSTRLANLNPQEVHYCNDELEEGSEHADFFGCTIRLGAGKNALVFAAEDAEKPFVTNNPQMLEALLPYLRAHIPPSSESAVARVRSVIAERVRGQRPTLRTVGKELAMSARALQRLLKENGTSFRQLLDEVRNEHARGYLSSTSFSDTEVSFLLGFEDTSSFYRAFRSWNGMTPSEFRRSL